MNPSEIPSIQPPQQASYNPEIYTHNKLPVIHSSSIQLQLRNMFVKLTVAAVISAVVLVSLTGSHAAPSTSPLHIIKRASSDSAMYIASVELLSSMLASHIALVCQRTLLD